MDTHRKLAERRESSLLSLFELSRELSVGLDPYAIAQLTLLNLMGHFGTAAAALWLLQGSAGNVPVLVRSFGVREAMTRALGEPIAARMGECMAQARTVEPVDEWAMAGSPDAEIALEAGFAVAAPMQVQGRLMGVVALGRRLDGTSYGALDLEYLSTAAGMVAVALENARLYHRARESNRQLRDSNERLTELDRLKSEFLSNVSHELLTPLAIIKAYLELLDATLTDAQAREAIGTSSSQAVNLENKIRNLLDFSKLEERALQLKLEPHDLGDLLRDFAEARRPGIADGLREFMLEVESSLPPVSCDRRRLLQILDELVDNAVKFTLPGSRIRLSAARAADLGDGGIEIELEDDGPGIPADRLEALFEPFRQGDGSSTREAGGMGLGLALARRLAEAMGGTLDAKSERGMGSRFVVRLRCA
ncbi:MAG TPA: ATP-binding protein [Candidatus Eisenbacteria bacterium]|nr:ATP-binding protein [Candidatus Eisenbacteria bacterium]